MAGIVIPAGIYRKMLAHCKEAFPDEACGILAGAGAEATAIYTLTNAEPSPVSYLMDPAEQFGVMKDMRQKGLSMLAIFHSHPSSQPVPSSKDVELAFYDDVLYIIAGLASEEAVVKAYSIRDGLVQEAEIVIMGPV